MHWDLLLDPSRSGEDNMARDAALAEAVALRLRPPALRLYGWDPPAVSIGRNQRPEAACDAAACSAEGWDVVRRPTGGRAVLHARDEVTYAVALPLDLAPDGVTAAYAWIGQALAAAYRRLGLPVDIAQGRRLDQRTGACFDAPAAHELTCRGRKVAGSAQVRRAGYLLQHGSLPLHFDADLHARLLGLPDGAADLLHDRAAGVADLDPAIGAADLREAVVAGFQQALGVRFEKRAG